MALHSDPKTRNHHAAYTQNAILPFIQKLVSSKTTEKYNIDLYETPFCYRSASRTGHVLNALGMQPIGHWILSNISPPLCKWRRKKKLKMKQFNVSLNRVQIHINGILVKFFSFPLQYHVCHSCRQSNNSMSTCKYRERGAPPLKES